MTQTPNRRDPLEPVPQGFSSLPYEQGRGYLHRFMLWVQANAFGIPGGFQDIEPTTIEPDAAGDPGDEANGWAAADHEHPIATAAPSSLGNSNSEGSSSSFARADHVHASGLTTKGDLLSYASGITRLAVGSNGLPLFADSSQSTGLRWGPIIVSPAQITGNQNDYAPGVANILRLSTDASRNITGMVAQASGIMCLLFNVGAQDIVLQHANVGSAAANQFLCPGAADLTIGAGDAALLVYDGTTAAWRVREL